MEEQPIWSFAFTPHEIGLLAAIQENGELVGLDEQFSGLQTDESKIRLESARQTLAEKGCLQFSSNGEIELDGAVYSLIQVTTQADRTLIVSCIAPDNDSRYRYIHLTEDLIVEQETLPDGQVMLTAVRNVETLAQRLEEFIGLAEAPTAPGPEVELNAADLVEARRLAETRDAHTCRAWLQRVGAPEATAIALAETLVGGRAISAVVLRREATEMRVGESRAWLADRAGVWSAQPVVGEIGQARIRLTPVTAAELHSQIKQVFLHERHEEMGPG